MTTSPVATGSHAEVPTATAEPRGPTSTSAEHAIEDVLVGIAIAAFAVDQRVPRDILLDVAKTLLQARSDARWRELHSAAHGEAESLPDWDCDSCHETNPGTFDVCWNCGQCACAERKRLSAEAEATLAIEATTMVPLE